MSEREPYQNVNKERGSVNQLRESIGRVASKPEFKDFLEELKRKVSIEELLKDRIAQARLDVLLNIYSERSERGDNLPMIRLQRGKIGEPRHTVSNEHARFQLVDEEYMYYFPITALNNEQVPHYLRPEDIVAEKDYQHPWIEVGGPFTKSINRVRIDGESSAEQYNYNTRQWEENGQVYFSGAKWRNSRHHSAFAPKSNRE